MKRMLLNEYRRLAFVGRPPCAATLKAMIEGGNLPGEHRGNLWFVFVDEYGEPVDTHHTGNALADQVLRKWQNQKQAS